MIDTLLCEMACLSVHEEEWDTEKWRQEMIRLRDAGAPLLPYESESGPEKPDEALPGTGQAD